MNNAPILLLASERSGTNLMRSMFNQHSQVVGPPVAHMLKIIWRNLELYGDLCVEDNLRAVAEDCIALTQSKFSNWPMKPTVESVLNGAPCPTLCGIVGQIHAELAKFEGKETWFCKENDLWQFAAGMAHAYPNCRIIYLFRDGRDVALSMQNARRSNMTFRELAIKWRREQHECQKVYTDLSALVRCTKLSYAELTRDPEKVLRKICDDIELPFEPTMLDWGQNNKTKQEAQNIKMWQNIDKPILKDNVAKYKTQVVPWKIALFESIAGDTLKALGYRLEVASTKNEEKTGSVVCCQSLREKAERWNLTRQMRKSPKEPARIDREQVVAQIRKRLLAKNRSDYLKSEV